MKHPKIYSINSGISDDCNFTSIHLTLESLVAEMDAIMENDSYRRIVIEAWNNMAQAWNADEKNTDMIAEREEDDEDFKFMDYLTAFPQECGYLFRGEVNNSVSITFYHINISVHTFSDALKEYTTEE